jgi:hypothetical protein
MSTPSNTASSRKLSIDDILDLRAYERVRDESRAEVIELKKLRRISLGPVVTLMFENRVTMRSQIHEMIRAEKVVRDEQVLEELNAYNPLIPEPGQLSATLFVELVTEDEMREWLPKLVNIESSIVIRLKDGTEIRSITEESHAEQLTRDYVTAAVHYIRFELTPEQIEKFALGGAEIVSDHTAYQQSVVLQSSTVKELLSDLWA